MTVELLGGDGLALAADVAPYADQAGAAYALARPVPRVLWKWAPSGRSPISGATLSMSETTRPGVAVPIVSAMEIRSAPACTAAATPPGG